MKTQRSNCPLVKSLDIFGDRWSLLILRDIIFKGKSQYREFLKSDEKISTNILADRLQRLVESDILSKHQNFDNKKVFDFYLTPKGVDLISIVVDIIAWGSKNIEDTAMPSVFLEKMKANREGFIASLMAKHSDGLL